ncbi:MAG TPA: class I SAM-dependent methyltransferase [Rubrivivax sp.]|nr:class I SAM-dependent methyltransferase [Rubrivivax sp.]
MALFAAARRACIGLCAVLAWLPAALRAQQHDVPFVVTPDAVTLAMLELAQVGPDDFVLDLGSGDGRIVINAARRFGARGLGVEIVPELVQRSRANAARAGVAERARFVEQDLFKTDLSAATVITMYLLQEVNLQLRPALLGLRPGTRIVSHDWDLGDWQPDRSRAADAPDKPVGREKLSRLHLWVVPARLHGDWCGSGVHAGARLRLRQQFQLFDATLSHGSDSVLLAGRIDGTRLTAADGFNARAEGRRLQVHAAGPAAPALDRAVFERCPG